MDMVTAVTSLGRSGLSDWLIQRISALVLLAYAGYLAYFLLANPALQYEQWAELFSCRGMRVFSVMALLSLVAHCWIGWWGITTDYLTERQLGSVGNILRWLAQAGVGLLLFIYLIWGLQVLWS
jgi:succinate dehydrogenase / fumarate reductase membrane anchor subunit